MQHTRRIITILHFNNVTSITKRKLDVISYEKLDVISYEKLDVISYEKLDVISYEKITTLKVEIFTNEKYCLPVCSLIQLQHDTRSKCGNR